MPSTPEAPEVQQFVLLKTGELLPCTAKQKEGIGMAILMTTDLNNQKIKLNGKIFKLIDMETDPQKLANARQQGLPLGDSKVIHRNQDMG